MFPLFITYINQVLKKTLQVAEQKCILILILYEAYENQILNYFNVTIIFDISKGCSNNFYKRIPGCCFNWWLVEKNKFSPDFKISFSVNRHSMFVLEYFSEEDAFVNCQNIEYLLN